MDITIYHNPKCSTSRNVLEHLRAAGHEPRVIEYLKTPLTGDELKNLVAEMGVKARDVVRAKEPLFKELGLETASEKDLITAMAKHPILVNRPIVAVKKGSKRTVRLCRPSETVKEML
jgi:arsenate reductase (glutaredoxin)